MEGLSALLIVVLGLAGLFVYFVPAFIAARREHPNQQGITLLNLLLGWTFLGWVIALVWAVSYSPPATAPLEPLARPNPAPPGFCAKCGARLVGEPRFCGNCGAAVPELAPEGAST